MALPVSGAGGPGAGLTDAELRALAVAVSGPLTDAQLRALAVAVSGPLTDAQLRALAVAVSGPLTDAELRATPVPVSFAQGATEVTLSALQTIIEDIRTNQALVPLLGSAPAVVSVGVASGVVIAANASRMGLVLTNLSVNLISLGINNPAVLNRGITLNPGGGVWVMDDYTFTRQAINGIASGAASDMAIQELT